MSPEEAIAIVAAHAVAHGAENIAQDGWDCYPELGEHDWVTVTERMKQLAPYPDVDQFDEAYALLQTRAVTE